MVYTFNFFKQDMHTQYAIDNSPNYMYSQMLIINCAPGLHMNMISSLFLLILSKHEIHTKNGPRCSCHQDPTKGPELQHVYLQKNKTKT